MDDIEIFYRDMIEQQKKISDERIKQCDESLQKLAMPDENDLSSGTKEECMR